MPLTTAENAEDFAEVNRGFSRFTGRPLHLPGFEIGKKLLEACGISALGLAARDGLLRDRNCFRLLAHIEQQVSLRSQVLKRLFHLDGLVYPDHRVVELVIVEVGGRDGQRYLPVGRIRGHGGIDLRPHQRLLIRNFVASFAPARQTWPLGAIGKSLPPPGAPSTVPSPSAVGPTEFALISADTFSDGISPQTVRPFTAGR